MSVHSSPPSPVEQKVKASTIGATLVTVILAALAAFGDNEQLLPGLPDWVPVLIAAVLTGGATFQAGFSAKHTPRPELPPLQQ